MEETDKSFKNSPLELEELLQEFLENKFTSAGFLQNEKYRNELAAISSKFYSLSGYDFLNFICALSAKLLNVDYVFIGEYISDTKKINVKTATNKGLPAETSEFDIEVSPIKNILNSQFICYPLNVQDNFPDDFSLKNHGAMSFAGVPLLNNSGEVCGMYYIYHTAEIKDAELIKTYLQLFSGRVASELKHIIKEEQLISGEKRYKLLFESANDTILLMKGPVVVECNSKTLEMYGCSSKGEIIGKTVMDFSPEKQPDGSSSETKAIQLIKDVENGLTRRFYWQHCKKDKTPFDAEVSLNPLRIEGAIHFQAIVRDITQQKQSLEIARKLSAAIEKSSSSIVITNISGEIEFVNPKFTELTGYTFDEVKGKNPRILKSEYTSDENYKNLWTTILAGNVWKGEFKNIKKNGEEYWESASIAPITQESGLITHFVAIKEDITEQKKVESLLKQSEERYQTVFENLHDVLYITDLNGTILELSPSIRFHFGYNREKLIGTSVYDVYYDANERENFLNIIKQNGFVTDYELALRNDNGDKVYCSANSRLIFDENGNPIQVEGIIRNITERKLNQEKLRLSEERLRKAQEIAKIGAFEFDVKEGVYWRSDEAKRILGTKTDFDVLPAEEIRKRFVDREKTTALLDNALKNQDSYNIEFDMYHVETNEIRTINSIAEIKRDKNGNPLKVLGLIADVTEKKNIEKELILAKEKAEENEKKLREASEIAKLGSWEFNIESKTFTFTDNFYKIFRTTAVEMGGYQMSIEAYYKRFVHPDDIKKVAIDIRNTIETSDTSISKYFEHRILYNDGGIGYIGVWLFVVKDAKENTLKSYGVSQDITERKITEQELIKAKEKVEESEIRFKSISENANDGITLADMDGHYVFANNAFAELTKYSIPEILQLKVFDIAKPDKNSSYQFNKIATNQAYSIRRELTCKDNSVIIADIHGKIIEISGEKLALGIVRDVTDIVKWENELISAKEKAEESDKLKTAFLLNVSHEIRTPMNGILGFLNLLKQPDLSDIEKSDFLEIVNKSGERLMNTINDIVEISKIETGDINLVFQEIDISEVLQYHYHFFGLEAEKKGLELVLKEQIKGNSTIIKTDKHKIDGILMNLIKNAIKFTDKGKIEFGNYIENDKICFYVSDTGIGIPDKKQEAIFARFVQAETGLNRNYEGSGIGLSIVKAHVEALQGNIQVKSKLGEGSTFLFSIPYNPVNMDIIQDNNKIDLQPNSDKCTILIAEDDEINYLLIERMLINDYKLIHATTGEEAIFILKNNPEISIILMDIKMPGKYDGLQTTKKIRQFNKKIPIVAQTAYAQSSDKMKAINAGCNDYISKPFNSGQLKSIINKYV